MDNNINIEVVIALQKVIEGLNELIDLNRDDYIGSANEVDKIISHSKKVQKQYIKGKLK